MSIQSININNAISFNGRVYLNKKDVMRNKPVLYDQIRTSAKGQIIESPRKDGFYWARIDDKNAKKVVNECKEANVLVFYLPGDISYKEFEDFAHKTW